MREVPSGQDSKYYNVQHKLGFCSRHGRKSDLAKLDAAKVQVAGREHELLAGLALHAHEAGRGGARHAQRILIGVNVRQVHACCSLVWCCHCWPACCVQVSLAAAPQHPGSN